jgi:hypothetical protein
MAPHDVQLAGLIPTGGGEWVLILLVLLLLFGGTKLPALAKGPRPVHEGVQEGLEGGGSPGPGQGRAEEARHGGHPRFELGTDPGGHAACRTAGAARRPRPAVFPSLTGACDAHSIPSAATPATPAPATRDHGQPFRLLFQRHRHRSRNGQHARIREGQGDRAARAVGGGAGHGDPQGARRGRRGEAHAGPHARQHHRHPPDEGRRHRRLRRDRGDAALLHPEGEPELPRPSARRDRHPLRDHRRRESARSWTARPTRARAR